ncbi:MAG: CCA tRNA nucleotidyltransferase [Proteobacteria bacterium]|nr:CCA tRNA nucleotidyltransferase [Pseudomonadota bacterium]
MKNIKGILVQKLPENITGLLESAGRCAEGMGFRAFVVGGMVRDLILNHENFDIDLVIEGEGIRFAGELAREHNADVRYYKKFGTAVLTFSDGFKLDVATARTETYEHPAALPKVLPGSIRDDMYRRDFTINTLAISLNPGHFGELMDFYNAERDIKRKLIKVLHDLSFIDDPTRVFRAVRFEQRFGFKTVRSTEKLIKDTVTMNVFAELAGYRISTELKLILQERNPLPVLKRLEELGVLELIHPKAVRNKELKRLLDKIGGMFPV